MPGLIKFLITHAAIGFGIAAIFVAGLLWADVAGLWTLISRSSSGWLAAFLLFFFNGLTFASLQMGFAVMLSGEDGGGNAKRAAPAFLKSLLDALRAPRRQPVLIPRR